MLQTACEQLARAHSLSIDSACYPTQHGFHSGDIVALRESSGSAASHKPDDSSGLRGLVFRVHETKIIIAVDAEASDEVLGR